MFLMCTPVVGRRPENELVQLDELKRNYPSRYSIASSSGGTRQGTSRSSSRTITRSSSTTLSSTSRVMPPLTTNIPYHILPLLSRACTPPPGQQGGVHPGGGFFPDLSNLSMTAMLLAAASSSGFSPHAAAMSASSAASPFSPYATQQQAFLFPYLAPRQNLEEILRHVVLADISVVSKAQRLAYLSCYVKFCSKLGKRINDEELIGFSLDEIFQW